MEKPTKIEFNVDEQYENEKGIFTVISIQKDQMVIRWESGEEISTDVALQTRIAERRQWEKLQKEAQAAAAKASRKAQANRKKAEFTGFVPTDFKKSASGTTWRSRNQLGKALITQIDTARFKLNSWAFGRKAEMHIQDSKHHDQGGSDYQARLFVSLDQQAIHYGFRVARPSTSEGESIDWDAFCSWLEEPVNEQTLLTLAIENDLAVNNLVAADDGWRIGKDSKQKGTESLLAIIKKAPKNDAFELEFTAMVAMEKAIEMGIDVAAKIARLFSDLLPLYQASVIR